VQNFTDQGMYLPKNVVNRKQFGLYNILIFVDYEQRVSIYGKKIVLNIVVKRNMM
jgi:hypothetical protein